MSPRRRGFVLLTVLSSLSLVAAIAVTTRLEGADAVTAAHNRIATERGRWLVRGCLASAVGALAGALRDASDDQRRDLLWGRLDAVLDEEPLGAGCAHVLEPSGLRLDVNAATEEQLLAALETAGVGPESPQLASAILDWRDADSSPRAGGAERAWYAAAGRPGPSDGPLRSREELRLVRGFERDHRVLEHFDVEPGPVLLSRASAPVLAAVSGLSIADAFRVVETVRRLPPRSVQSLLATLPEETRIALLPRFDGFARAITLTPSAWVLTAAVTVGSPAVTSMISARLIRTSSSLWIEEARTW